jgi:hypothetical protein
MPRPSFFVHALQASLLRAQPSATALRPGGLVEPPAAPTTLVVSVVAVVLVTVIGAAIIVIATSLIAAAGLSAWITLGRTPPEIPPRTRSSGPVFGDVEPQGASAHFASVQLLDSLRRVLLGREPNEREAPRAARFPVLWNVDVNDLTNLSEQSAKLLVRRAKAEVPYEYLA